MKFSTLVLASLSATSTAASSAMEASVPDSLRGLRGTDDNGRDLLAVKNGDGTCTLCFDGSSVPDGTKTFTVFGDTQTCEAIELSLSYLPYAVGTMECLNYQMTAGIQCGCTPPEPAKGSCTLCPDGTPVDDAHKTAPTNFPGELTCGDLESFVPAAMANDEACISMQSIGYGECGCMPPESATTQGGCTLCPDGSSIPDGTKISTAFEGETCASIEQAMLLYASSYDAGSEVCKMVQMVGAMVAIECGCPPLEAKEGSCTLCPDGSSVPDGTKISTAFEGETCAWIEQEMLLYASSYDAGSEDCKEAQMGWAMAAIECGCPPPKAKEGSCTLCPDGSSVPDGTKISTAFEGKTCASIEQNLAPYLGAGSEYCKQLQMDAAIECGCPADDENARGHLVHGDFIPDEDYEEGELQYADELDEDYEN